MENIILDRDDNLIITDYHPISQFLKTQEWYTTWEQSNRQFQSLISIAFYLIYSALIYQIKSVDHIEYAKVDQLNFTHTFHLLISLISFSFGFILCDTKLSNLLLTNYYFPNGNLTNIQENVSATIALGWMGVAICWILNFPYLPKGVFLEGPLTCMLILLAYISWFSWTWSFV
jgi:hypothetical protein